MRLLEKLRDKIVLDRFRKGFEIYVDFNLHLYKAKIYYWVEDKNYEE